MSEVKLPEKEVYVDFVSMLTREELERVLEPYKNSEQYEEAVRYYDGCVDSMGSAQLLEPLSLLRQTLEGLQGRGRRRRTPAGPDSGRTAGLTKVVGGVTDYEARLRNGIERPPATAVPKKLHFVWLGGALGQIQLDYINIWKKVMPDDYVVNVWHDEDGLLAHEATRIIVEAGKAATWVSEDQAQSSPEVLADRYEARITALKREMFLHINRAMARGESADEARIDLLVKGYGQDESRLRALKERNAQVMRDLVNDGLQLRNVTELPTFPELKEFYHREMGLRGNLAAASDLVRMLVEVAEGGIYSDVDFLPPFVDDVAGIDINQLATAPRRGVLQLLLDNNPEWMPGRRASGEGFKDHTGFILKDDRNALERFAKSRPPLEQVFAPFKQTSVPVDSLRLPSIEGGESNALIVSHPGSAPLWTIIRRFETYHQALLEIERQALKSNIGFHESNRLWELAIEVIKDRIHFAQPKIDQMNLGPENLAISMSDYFSDGIRPQARGTIHLTGPGALRAGLEEYNDKAFTPDVVGAVRESVRLYTGFNNATEEEADHSWLENAPELSWLERETTSWREGKFRVRYAGKIAQLLKGSTLEFNGGWPAIEGHPILSTDLLQHLAAELGEPFKDAMQRGHDVSKTFDSPIPLSFEERQYVSSQGVVAPAFLNDPQNKQRSVRELLERHAESPLLAIELSPLERLQLGPLIGAKALDNHGFEAARPQLDKLADNTSRFGTAFGYTTIERTLLQSRAPEFMAGLASTGDYPPVHGKTASQLMSYALDQRLTLREWGRCVAEVKRVAQLEHKATKNQVNKIVDGLPETRMKVAPQDLLTSREGSISGRCYPLSLVTAAALSEGRGAVDVLFDRFYAVMNDHGASDSATFLNILESVGTVKLDTVLGATQRSTLQNIVDVLEAKSATATLMLNSGNHAMLVARVFNGTSSTYHLYDPNIGLFSPTDTLMFKDLLERLFIEQKMAARYDAFGPGHTTFDLIELDGARLSSLALPGEVTVSQLIRPGALPGQSLIPARKRMASALGQSLQNNVELGSSLRALDGHRQAQQISEATTQLREANNLAPSLVPLFDSLEALPEGGFRITLIDREQPQRVTYAKTKDPRFKQIKRYLSEHFTAMGANTPDMLEDPTHVGGVHTLNAGFSILALMHALQGREGDDRSLTTAVRLHAYVGYAQLAQGHLSDINAMVQLVREALKDEKVIASTVAPAIKASLGSSVSEATAGLLQFVSVGLDIYQLATTQNDVERAEFGTQLAFDTASLLLWGGAYAAGATAGAVLGGAAVIVGGLAFGVSAVVKGFAVIAEQAKQVGLFFDDVEKAHHHAYTFDTTHTLWKPDSSLVIKTMDLRSSTLSVDGPKLYPQRDHLGVPTMILDYDRAIDIRKELGLPDQVEFKPLANQGIVLPYIPHSCYRYEYKALPFANSYHWTGFDTARRLEKWQEKEGQWLFQFSFYSFPSHQILNRLFSPDYRPTTVDVWLDDVDRSLLVPKLQPIWMDKIEYHIRGAGKRCSVLLHPGVSLILETTAPLKSAWMLDAPWAEESDVQLEGSDKLFIGDVAVSITGTGHNDMLIRINRDQILKVDAGELSHVVVGLKPGMDSQAAHDYMKTLAQQHRLVAPYTPVHQYLVPFEDPDEPRYVTAWYDAEKDRHLYIRDEIPGVEDAELGAVTDGYAWFYNPEEVRIWQVDADNGQVIRCYWLWCPQSMTSKVQSIEVDARGMISFSQHVAHKDGSRDVLGYLIHDEKLLLSSVIRGRDNRLESVFNAAETLADWSSVLREAFVVQAHLSNGHAFDTVVWQPAPFVSVCWKIDDESRDMAWIRSRDRLIIRPSPRPKHYRAWPDSIKNLTDLALLPPVDGGDSFIIYNRLTQFLCHQQRTLVGGKGQWTVSWKRPAKLNNIVAADNGYVAVDGDGLFFNLTPQFELSFAGVGELWLKDRQHWWSDLEALGGKYKVDSFAIAGLTNAAGDSKLCAWYMGGRLLLANLGYAKDVRLLRANPDSEAAWLFDVSGGVVYRQAFIDPQALTLAFGNGSKLLKAGAIPAAEREWDPLQFIKLTTDGPGLRGVTFEGVIVTLREGEPALITGVTEDWVAIQGDRVLEGLERLAAQPSCSALLTVEDADQLKWFVAATGKLIQAPKSAAPQVFDVLGTLSHNNVLLHDKTDGKLRLLPKPKQTASLAYVLREGEVMVVEGQALKSGDLRPLVPDDVRTLVLRLGLGETTYRLSKTVLLLVDSVILDCQRLLGSVVTSPSKFIWELDKPDQLLLSKVDEHLVIIDPDSGRSVIGRDVFATDDNLLGDVLLSFGDDRHCELSFLISSMRALSDNQNGTTLGKVFAVTAVPTT